MDTTIAPTADLVVLDDVTALTDSDTEGTSNAIIGAACIAAGVAIGTFLVPPVVGYVKSWFTSAPAAPETVVEKIEEIMTPTAKTKENKSA